MSSSNRGSQPATAVVYSQDKPAGPLLMPETNSDAFVAEFNRTYGAIGLTICPVTKTVVRETPGGRLS